MGEGWGFGRGRRMDRRTGPNQFALQLFRVGGITVHLCTSYVPDKLNL